LPQELAASTLNIDWTQFHHVEETRRPPPPSTPSVSTNLDRATPWSQALTPRPLPIVDSSHLPVVSDSLPEFQFLICQAYRRRGLTRLTSAWCPSAASITHQRPYLTSRNLLRPWIRSTTPSPRCIGKQRQRENGICRGCASPNRILVVGAYEPSSPLPPLHIPSTHSHRRPLGVAQFFAVLHHRRGSAIGCGRGELLHESR
jgi:hypothetical protein